MEYKTVELKKNPKHHSGFNMGFTVKSTVLPNCVKTVSTEKEANELAKYWDSVANSMFY